MVDGLHYTDVVINSEKEIIELLEKAFADPFNKKKKPEQILDELGFVDTITLLDPRSSQLLELYGFYKHAPHECSNSDIWFEAYQLINQVEENIRPRLF